MVTLNCGLMKRCQSVEGATLKYLNGEKRSKPAAMVMSLAGVRGSRTARENRGAQVRVCDAPACRLSARRCRHFKHQLARPHPNILAPSLHRQRAARSAKHAPRCYRQVTCAERP